MHRDAARDPPPPHTHTPPAGFGSPPRGNTTGLISVSTTAIPQHSPWGCGVRASSSFIDPVLFAREHAGHSLVADDVEPRIFVRRPEFHFALCSLRWPDEILNQISGLVMPFLGGLPKPGGEVA